MSAAHRHAVDSSSPSVRLGPIAQQVAKTAFAVAGIALVISVIIAVAGLFGTTAKGAFKSWMVAFLYVLSICLGALFFTMIQHAVRAGWSVTVRRIAESIAANLLWLWVLFLPVFILVLIDRGGVLFPWLKPEYMATDAIIQHKMAYLNKGFFLLRAVFFFAVWAGFAWFFWSSSVRQDESGDVALTHRMQRLAPLGLLAFALTLTFAAFDWAMSLEPHWFSTIFGVYFFAVSCCGFGASMCIALWFLGRRGKLLNEVTSEHMQDVGKFLFGFGIVFHAYIGFSQFMLIWYANIPEETGWYLARTLGPWKPFMWALLICHFAVPFLLLISRHAKRNRTFIAAVAVFLLLVQFLDIYLLVMPAISGADLASAVSYPALAARAASGDLDLGFHPGLIDLTCVIGALSLLVGLTARRLGQVPLVPVRDPRLPEALAFENM